MKKKWIKCGRHILLAHGIGLTKEQLSNICIVCNGYDAKNKNRDTSYLGHIQWAERRLIGITHNQGSLVHGLLVSSLGLDVKHILCSEFDYVFMHLKPTSQYVDSVSTSCWGNMSCIPYKSKSKYNVSGLVSSFWSRVRTFEDTRYALIQADIKHKTSRIIVNHQLHKEAQRLQLPVAFS